MRGAPTSLEAFARGELGMKLAPSAEAFAFGEAQLGQLGPAFQAGIGARVRF